MTIYQYEYVLCYCIDSHRDESVGSFVGVLFSHCVCVSLCVAVSG